MFQDHEACYRAIETGDPRFDGRVFTGVKSTGIYCRPVCPARTPRRKNVEFFPSAAAAQDSGYRPCLRCRPELSPASGIHSGIPDIVIRALAFIAEGALDDDGLPELAARLAISERQLRRMFNQHLGASPLKIAQTRRVLFAKQLLHDTTLSMADVAMASGFGSIRRFNATFNALFGKSPRALRRDPPKDNNSSNRRDGNWIELRLAFRPPLDWNFFLDFYRARSVAGVETIQGDRYLRVIKLDEDVGLVEIRPGRGNYLLAGIRFPNVSALPRIVRRLRHAFDLDADPALIRQHLSTDLFLNRIIDARPGLRVAGNWDPFEQAVRAVLGQQISVRAARNLASRLVERWGDTVQFGEVEELRFAFPTPAQLAHADIAALGMPRHRAAALTTLARAVEADPDFLEAGPNLDNVLQRLKALPGFGDWTANYIAMRALREPDAFPAGDVALQRALTHDDGTRPTAAQLLSRAEPWRPWRAYAAQYLWVTERTKKPVQRATTGG